MAPPRNAAAAFRTAPTSIPFLVCGPVIAGAFIALSRTGFRTGGREHLLLLAIAASAYAVAVGSLFIGRVPPSRTLLVCLLLALAARVPLATKPAGTLDDTHRYTWDARLQRAGLNPYLVVPNDPHFEWVHTRETRLMNNTDVPSPYPPGAQLFLRAVTAFGESAVAFKCALVVAEALTVVLLMLWLPHIGKDQAWVLAYAWHPIAIFETASAGHLDALGTMFVVAAATALARRWRLVAALALAAGAAVKFLPLVLAPLLLRRVRWIHGLAASALLVAVYVPFLDGWRVPPGSLGAVIDRFRFNHLLFDPVAAMAGTRAAVAIAVLAGLTAAGWYVARRREQDPAAWAWPVALVLLLSPVIYPWYLVWLLPFLVVRSTLPLLVWSLAIIPTYLVWHQSRAGGPWAVPAGVLWIEYGLLGLSAGVLALSARAGWGSGGGDEAHQRHGWQERHQGPP
ncbi:MAG: hypothetical protein LC753_11835 [Acidobacteria bacterium]|nr:hypothetical protein [Acidobacteriota bacterium]MCA1650926.1 hypothetical protein [Acidobacteriota bacterium]